MVLLGERRKILLRELILAPEILDSDVFHFEEVGVVLLLSLLADEHHGLFAALHARIFERLLNKFSFARLQKAEEHIY